MSDISFEKILEPLLPDAPSGPDLDMEGDPAFWAFTSQLDVFLPTSYASFDRTEKPVGELIGAARTLLGRTIDLRLLSAIAKLSILDLKLPDFERAIGAIAQLLEQRWDHVHPQMDEMNQVMRFNALISLDDLPHVVLPLQQAPLFRSKRLGPVTIRMQMLAEGVIEQRAATETEQAENIPSAADFRAAMDEGSAEEITASFETAKRLAAALAAIETIYAEKSGEYGALTLKRLRPLADRIAAFLEQAMVAKGLLAPEAASQAQDAGSDRALAHMPGGGPNTGSVRSIGQAVRALDAAALYFSRNEPSSPTRLLLAQARSLVGKSLFEALQELLPDHASKAVLVLGRDLPVSLPVERLVQFLPADSVSFDEEESGGDDTSETDWDAASHESDETPAPEDLSETEASEAESGEAGEGDGVASGDSGAESDSAGESGAAEESEPEPEPLEEPPPPAAPSRPPVQSAPVNYLASTRTEAIRLLEEVTAFYRVAEPSSPIPQLLDAARQNAGFDFSQVLKTILPELYLRVDD